MRRLFIGCYMRMTWNKLLSTKRTRELMGGRASRTGDLRDEFRRDYGRVVFSTPLRRLQDKAQVFPLEDHDAVRTRLTHTGEVSSIAQDIAQQICTKLWNEKKINYNQSKAIETIAMTCALLHDMGNPPFGHAGEDSIADWFKKHTNDEDFWEGIVGRGEKEDLSSDQLKNDFLEFEGNAQTIRLIAKLQLLNDMHGLNMTAGTVSAALKYVAGSHQLDSERQQFKKHGYFASESEIVAKVRKITGTGSNSAPLRNPITFIVEAADDLAYASVDLEDAIRKKVIAWDELKEGLISEAAGLGVKPKMKELLAEAKKLIDGYAELPMSPWDRAEGYAIMFRTRLIATGAGAAVDVFHENYNPIMEGKMDKALLDQHEAGKLVKAAKSFAAKQIYPHTSRLELLGRNVIHQLMDFFWAELKACPKMETIKPSTFRSKAIKLISSNYRHIYESQKSQGKLPARYMEFQLITDYISGMTDSFACSLHRKIFNG